MIKFYIIQGEYSVVPSDASLALKPGTTVRDVTPGEDVPPPPNIDRCALDSAIILTVENMGLRPPERGPGFAPSSWRQFADELARRLRL